MLISSIPPSFGRIVFDLKVACAGPGWIPFACNLSPANYPSLSGSARDSVRSRLGAVRSIASLRGHLRVTYDVFSICPSSEQRLGERSRFRAEAFDRQNEQREDIFLLSPKPLKQSAVFGRDYSRGCSSCCSGVARIGFLDGSATLWSSRDPEHMQIPLPPPLGSFGQNTPYSPTFADQRHTVNLFASYRLKPTVRFSVKGVYGSGFPVNTFPPPILRIGPYERLDLRADKSWLFRKWKLSLYGELLNATNHDNRRFAGLGFNSTTKQFVLFTNDGIPRRPRWAGFRF